MESWSADSSPCSGEFFAHGRLQVFVIGTTLIDWDFVKLLKGYGPAESFKGDFFLINWLVRVAYVVAVEAGQPHSRRQQTCQVYFAVDLIWVSFVPTCVKSPGTIIKVWIGLVALVR